MRGHVTKRGKKWTAVVYLGVDEANKKKYKWYGGFDTKKEAEKFLASKVVEVNAGTYVDNKGQTVESHFHTWLEYKRTRVRIGTYVNYKKTVDKHIVPHLGHIQLDKLKPQHLQKLYTTLLDSGLKSTSVNEVHTMISAGLKLAVKWGVISRNVAQLVDPPRRTPRNMSVWTVEQSQQFLAAAKESKFYIAYLLAITTGMRRGEIVALHWKDVDTENHRLQVVWSLNFYNNKPTFDPPKTAKGRRTVTFPEVVSEAFTTHRTRQVEMRLKAGSMYQDQDLVITKPNGNPYHVDRLYKDFLSILRETGLPRIRFHDLRHTHASLLLEQGVHPKVVQERLGHASIKMTMDIYSHVLPGIQEKVADDFGELLKRKKKLD